MALAVASRYARALADLALDPQRGADPEALTAELEAVERALDESPALRNVLLSPAVTPARKRAVVARLSAIAGLSRLLRNFLYVVIDRRRIGLLGEIRQAFRSVVDERTGTLEAGIATARELSADERAHVSARLGQVTGMKVRCRFAEDQALIGGMVARIGSTVFDGSVRGQLEALRRRLTE